MSTHGNHPVFGVKRKWLIKIRTKAVKAARVVNTRAASSLDRADSRAAAGSRSPASSSRSPDAKAASRVAKAVRAGSADCPRFGLLPRFGGDFFTEWTDRVAFG